MTAKKRPALPLDPSLHPTRKVESMSSIAAELLLQDQEQAQESPPYSSNHRFDAFDSNRFDEESGRRIRSSRPPSMSEPWRPPSPWHTPAAPPPRRGLRIVLLAGGAVLLVVVSVGVTLLVAR